MSQSCAQCGKLFPQEEMVKFENSWVCVGCKPVFLQKLKEGIRTSTDLVYGGFWIRVGAKIIDGILMQLLNYAIVIPLFAMSNTATPTGFSMILVIQIVAGMVLQIAFTTFFLGKYGATPGKMACRLRVVNPDGTAITYGKGFGRYWGEMLSGFTIGIGYLMVAWDEERRGLHDRVCNTRVIRIS